MEAVPVPPAVGGADTGGDEQNYVFDCSKTVLFDEEGRGYVAPEQVTAAIGLTGQAEGILLPIKTEDGFMDVFVKKSLEWWHIKKDGAVTLAPLYFVKVIATDLAESPKDLKDAFVEEEVKKYVVNLVTNSFALGEQLGLDPFSVKGKYYKKYGTKNKIEKCNLRLAVKVMVSDA